MVVNDIESRGILGVHKEKVIAYVFTYNRNPDEGFDDVIEFISFTKDYLSHIKRKQWKYQ